MSWEFGAISNLSSINPPDSIHAAADKLTQCVNSRLASSLVGWLFISQMRTYHN